MFAISKTQIKNNTERRRAGFCALLAAAFFCAPSLRAQTPITLNITNTPGGYVVPADFPGLSFEIGTQKPGRGGVSGCIFSPTNTPLVTLFQNIGLRSLRIGGGTADGTKAALLSHSEIDNLFGFARAVGNLGVIYTLQLENGNPTADAKTAQYIWQNYRSQLSSFAIGNEPDWKSYSYPPYGKGTDPLITGYASYLSDWKNFASAVRALIPDATFSGPDTGGDLDAGAPDKSNGYWAHSGTEWTTRFAHDEQASGLVTLITQHEYEADTLKGPAPTNASQFIDAMLSPVWNTVTNQTLYNAFAAPVLAEGLPYRFTEANEMVGGLAHASATMANALWTLDYMHWWAAHGCAGVNFHNKPWLLTDTIYYNKSEGIYEVHPKAYAIKAFVLGSKGREQSVSLVNPNNLNLTAYAIGNSTNLFVTIINREHNTDALNANVTINLNGFAQSASVTAMYLTATGNNIAATNNITLGNGTITNNAAFNGSWTALNSASNDPCTVTVAASSAAVLKIIALQ